MMIRLRAALIFVALFVIVVVGLARVWLSIQLERRRDNGR